MYLTADESKTRVEILKSEVHRMLSWLRSSERFSSDIRFSREVPLASETPSVRSFKALYRRLQDMDDLFGIDAVAYTRPFLDVITSGDSSSVITGASLSSVNKFLLYGFLSHDVPRAAEAINQIAVAITHCRFEPSSSTDDEVVLMRLLEVIGNALRCDAGNSLTDDNVWDMSQCAFLISRVERGSHLLQKSGESTLSQIIMHVFSRTDELSVLSSSSSISISQKVTSTANSTTAGHSSLLMPYGPKILSRLLQWLASLADPRQHGRATRMLGLELVNTVLETGGGALGNIPCVLAVIQADLCKFLIANSRTLDLPTLSLALRVVFNLFASLKQFLKVQLEVFLTSVHLFLADSRTAPPEQKELALESLLEFCKEPSMMIDLYVNFDCDVACANLFEALCRCLCRCSVPEIGTPITSLHAIALDGILSVVSSMAQRCPGHPAWRQRGAGLFINRSNLNVGEANNISSSRDIYSDAMTDQAAIVAQLADGGTGGASGSNSGIVGHWQLESKDHAKEREETAAVLRSRRQLKKRLALAAAKFNTDQKGWIEVLQELGLLPTPADAPSVAKFLLECPSLDRVLVGLYLSEPADAKHVFNAAVRNCYVSSFKFAGLRIDDALRVFLESFRLPGEAQKIERLMLAFSEHFFAESPGPMHHADTAFVLAYSIIMLNTDLHNRQVRKKMTVEQFVSNNRGIDCGNNLPPEYLTAIYESILEKEIMLRADAPQFGVSAAGGGYISGLSSSSSMGTSSGGKNNGVSPNTSQSNRQVSTSSSSTSASSSSSSSAASATVESDATQQLGTQWDGVLRRQNTVLSYTPSGASLSGIASQSRFGRARAGSGSGTQSDHTGSLLTSTISDGNNSSNIGGGGGGVVGNSGVPPPSSSSLTMIDEPPVFVLAGAHERDMFLLIFEPCLHAVITVFETTRDPAVLRRAAVGFRDVALLAAYYNMSGPINTLVVAISRRALSDMDAISDLDENDVGVFELAKSIVRSFVKSKKSTLVKGSSISSAGGDLHSGAEQSPSLLNGGLSISSAAAASIVAKSSPANHYLKTSSSSSPPSSPLRLPSSLIGQGGIPISPQISTPTATFNRAITSTGQLSDVATPLLSIDTLSKGSHPRTSHVTAAHQASDIKIDTTTSLVDNGDGETDSDDSSSLYSLLLDADIDSFEVNLSFSSSFQGDSAYLLRRMLLALRMLFHISSSHPELLREGWKNVSEVMIRLSVNECLPSGFLQLDDFRATNGMVLPSVSDERSDDASSTMPLILSGSKYIRDLFSSLDEDSKDGHDKTSNRYQSRLKRLIESPIIRGISDSDISRQEGKNDAFDVLPAQERSSLSSLTSGNPATTLSLTDRGSSGSIYPNKNGGGGGGGGIWESLTSFFGGFLETTDSVNDFNTDAVLTAVACEISRTRAPFLILSKCAVLPDDTLTQLLHALVTVRNPATLGQALALSPSGGGSGGGGMGASGGNNSQSINDSEDYTSIVSAITAVEVVAEISLQNAYRSHVALPLLFFFYRTLMAHAAPTPSPSDPSQTSTSKEACYIGERIVVNLMRIAARALTIDETWVREQQSANALLLGPRYTQQQQDAPSLETAASPHTTADAVESNDLLTSDAASALTSHLATTPSLQQSSNNVAPTTELETPLSVVITCLRTISAFPEPVFAACAPRIAAGVSFLVHIGPSLSHLVPLSLATSATSSSSSSSSSLSLASVMSSNNQQSKDFALKLKTFFDLVFALLERCHQRFLASPGVWDTLVRLASSVSTLSLVTATPESSSLREHLFSLHVSVMHETQRFLLRHLLPSTSDEIISGCAAAVLLSDHQGSHADHFSGGSNDGGPRDHSVSGLTRKLSSVAETTGSAGSASQSSTSLSSASSLFENTLRGLIKGQTASDLRIFASNAVLRLFESLALNANVTTELGAEEQWISSICGLRDVAASLGSLSITTTSSTQQQQQQQNSFSQGALRSSGGVQRLIFGTIQRLVASHPKSLSFKSWSDFFAAVAVLQKSSLSCSLLSTEQTQQPLLDLAEAVVQVNAISGKGIWHASCSSSLSSSEFLLLWTSVLNELLEQISTCALAESRFVVNRPPSTTAASRNLITESLQDDVRKLFIVAGTKASLQNAKLTETDSETSTSDQKRDEKHVQPFLPEGVWKRVQELLPQSLVNELRIAAEGGNSTNSNSLTTMTTDALATREVSAASTGSPSTTSKSMSTSTTRSEIEIDAMSLGGNPPSPPSLKRNASLAPSSSLSTSSGMLAPAPELRGFVTASTLTIEQQSSSTFEQQQQKPSTGGGIFSFLF
jgi:hypothetical protein